MAKKTAKTNNANRIIMIILAITIILAMVLSMFRF